jgi:hypothetical protein
MTGATSYERALRSLLWRARPRRLEARVARWLKAAERVALRRRIERDDALAVVYGQARRRVIERLLRRRTGASAASQERLRTLLETCIPRAPVGAGPDFHCDAALGGLARWLRAAGYDAAFWPGIDDDALLRKLPRSTAILLTTDSRLMARGVIEQGAIAGLLVPVALKKREQFSFVRARLELPLKPARCIACGGQLERVAKESVRARIPPCTWPWLDDYFLCRRCDRLFWQGTHWQKIRNVLA